MSKKFYKHEYIGKYKFLKNWFDDREGKDFEQKIDNWLVQFDNDEKEFLIECLKRYTFFRAAEYKYGQKILYSKLQDLIPNWKETSFIFKVEKEGASYSDNLFNDFWFTNNIKNECKQNLDSFSDSFDLLSNIIFIDDFIGSGNTFIKYLTKIIQKYSVLATKQIVILAMYLTRSGELTLKNYAVDRQLNLHILSYKKGDKFFKEGKYFSGKQLQDKIALYQNICDKVLLTKQYRFGYEDTQSLFTICDNTPNNTLSIFWENNNKYNSLMTRYAEDKTQLQKAIELRRRQKECKKQVFYKKEIDSYQNLLFIGYCARKKTKFNFGEAVLRFGLTQEQLNDKINFAIDNGYLIIKDGRFVETQKFWKSVTKSRYKRYFEDFINEVFEEKTLDLKNTKYIPLNFDEKFKGYK